MNTKTIKLQTGEYTDFTTEFDEHDIVILNGARGSGKSYPVAKHISKLLEADKNAKFIYMRIRDQELATFISWCTDLNLAALAESPVYRLQRGKPTKGDILLTGYDEDGIQLTERVIGKCVSLESSHIFKSGKYDEFVAIVFEEYTHLHMNPANEKTYVFNFLENVVSVFRDRPKHIFLMCNSLKNIPLLDRAIDELTGELFKTPLKVRIFRKSANSSINSFMAYLNGELYDDESFKVDTDEFFVLYVNKNYVIKQHSVYSRKFYVMANKNNRKMIYKEDEYLRLKYFCQGSATNEFYYQNNGIEKSFIQDYNTVISEIAKQASTLGRAFIV